MTYYAYILVILLNFSMCRLFGTRSSFRGFYWVVTRINFTSIFPRTCGALDYYNWIVSNRVSKLIFKSVYYTWTKYKRNIINIVFYYHKNVQRL